MLGILVIYVLTKTITGPLNEVTKVASIMAKGDFKVKSKKYYEDEIGKLSDTLNFLSDEIIKKDDLKNDFISSVSHELRTPLTSIKGWAITLKEFGSDKEMLSDGLDIIEKESDRLSGMVEELLDFSKFVSGKITLNL
ncbi:MAG: histidine kinase dimerization/phospho-acceptor domain-containing protein, partial [Clostridium sp.]